MGHVGVGPYLNRFGMTEESTCQNPRCNMEGTIDTVEHFLLHCPAYACDREEFRRKLSLAGVVEFNLKTILLGSDADESRNAIICKHLTVFLRSTNRTQSFF